METMIDCDTYQSLEMSSQGVHMLMYAHPTLFGRPERPSKNLLPVLILAFDQWPVADVPDSPSAYYSEHRKKLEDINYGQDMTTDDLAELDLWLRRYQAEIETYEPQRSRLSSPQFANVVSTYLIEQRDRTWAQRDLVALALGISI